MRLILSTTLLLATLSLSANDRPNILFILADDLGWADTTLYGHTQLYETPNLERLAARGMTFERAYTASPLCSPTRSSILTGLHPARTGLTAPNCHLPKVVLEATTSSKAPPRRKLTTYSPVTRLDPKYDTLTELLQKDGYVTAHFGKWHLGAPPYSPLEHGFDIDIPHHPGPGPAGSFVAPWKFKNFKENYPGEHIEDRMGDEAVAFLEKHGDEPFFLNYWQFSVHAPFDAKKELIEKYRGRIDPNDAQRSPTYAAMVQSLDENVGKMLDALDRLELADNTVIVFYSDNGGNMYNEVDGTTPTSNRPLRGGKGNNWDGGVRVPCIVVWPGETRPGSRSDRLITSTDFYPTLLSMAGLELSGNLALDGVDITPLLGGKTIERDAIFTFFPHSTGVPDTLPPSASVYMGDWKLLRLLHDGKDGSHEHRLFHLAEDIGERNNLAGSHPERVAAMATKLDQFLLDTSAVYQKPNPDFDPTAAALSAAGITPTKNCTLAVDEANLLLQTSGDNPHLTIRFRKPLENGKLKLLVEFTSTEGGRIDFRWGEKGIQPLFFKDRLERSSIFQPNEKNRVEIPFSADRPVTSSRVDFMQPGGTIRIKRISILRNGTPQWTSDSVIAP